MPEQAVENTPVIVLRDVWKTYQTGAVSLTALRGINLDITRGEFAAIMGPSGSGKSTLMNVIGCLDQKDQGSYELNGVSITDLGPNDLARIRNEEIGFIFQSFNLLAKLNLRENVELPMVYAGIPRRERSERAMEALESVGLADWARHKPNEVSGGQKQRAAIARAVALKPALLMADEPTGNLDSRSSREIMKLFRQLNHDGATIVLITHDATIASNASRILTVSDGQLIADSCGINAPVEAPAFGDDLPEDPNSIRTSTVITEVHADKGSAENPIPSENGAAGEDSSRENGMTKATDQGGAHVH